MQLSSLLSVVLSFLVALMAMAFYTLVERKLLGYMQLRKGPNKVMLMGLPQPLADAMKLFLKEQMLPSNANKSPFIMAPVMSLFLSLLLWSIFPHMNPSFWMQYGILYFMCVSAMNVYATFLAGWSSNSKYALLGALRGVAQTISYEISMSLILLSALLLLTSMDMNMMTTSTFTPVALMMIPVAIIWFITNLAETNRAPFDFAEGESELVSGFNVEYGSSMFALIFMAEYCNILFMSLLTSVVFYSLFMKFMSLTLIISTIIISSVFIWVRASFPRMRYDSLMMLTWKSFLPFSICMLMLTMPMSIIMNY
uniref:NADH-ubiquinone oxidoreductase chain 1 n=1 Tax=Erpobdella octoculata TaxID=39305 RepID=A0A7D7F9B1_9ANNE|nr:NADH dehydrogenase subunit 1 [Erpobdella octoculata]UZT67808.1 NADH dehydrogenase subunit 1 [Erpobdella octoculata]